MLEIDAAARERFGIPRLLLMEHAGLAVARAARTLLPTPSAAILVCCGNGYNGGDGLCAARHLADWGYRLRVLVTGRLSALREEPAVYATIIQRLGVPVVELADPQLPAHVTSWMEEAELIIDALVGIGVRGAVREPLASLIELMNRAGKPIVAVDIPSGLDGDHGTIQGVAVKAMVTVTFGLPKHGCLMSEGPAQSGSLVIDPITIPRLLLESGAPQ